MGEWRSLGFGTGGVSKGVGKFYRGNVNDDKFQPNEIITWENTQGSSGNSLQWIGWQDRYAFHIHFERICYLQQRYNVTPKFGNALFSCSCILHQLVLPRLSGIALG